MNRGVLAREGKNVKRETKTDKGRRHIGARNGKEANKKAHGRKKKKEIVDTKRRAKLPKQAIARRDQWATSQGDYKGAKITKTNRDANVSHFRSASASARHSS